MRYLEAIRAQGKNLRASRAAVTAQLAGLDLARWRGRRLGLIGMGASKNAIDCVIGSYWAAGLPASSWLGTQAQLPGAAGSIDAVIAVTQSGRSAEVVDSLASLPPDLPKLAVTDDDQSPAARAADVTVGLSLLEDSKVRTLGHTGTVQALLLLSDALTGQPVRDDCDWDWLADETDRLVPLAEEFADQILPRLQEVSSVDVAGPGAGAGTAIQGALLFREVCKMPAAGYETYQYMHGPLEAVGPGLALILAGGAREARLAQSVTGSGAQVILITAEEVPAQPGLSVFQLSPERGGVLRAILGLLPLQAITAALARARNLPDGQFRYDQDDTKVD
jgi:glutamine---fructose-6-phosphate transaminase (isomerizing)